MDEYEQQEKVITDALNKYKKNRDKEIYRKISHELDMYLLYLDENFADKEKYQWHTTQKKLLNKLKQEKQLIGTPSKNEIVGDDGENLPLNPALGKQVTQKIKNQVTEALNGAERGVTKAIQISNFIKIELDKQIEQLDKVYEENKNFEARMKRAKEGLIVILRQAMTNKITRFFAILLVLAIIGVTVVSILRSNGQIA